MLKDISNCKQSLEDDVVLRVENLYKKFCRTLKRSMYYGAVDSMRSMMGISYNTDVLRKNEFWALEDVSFELKKGEALGIIGVNGSGKSTLLRLITGIFPPDKGSISFKGRIGALIAVGAGFHPHMTGRENIYLNATILGMTRKEIDEKINDIIDFADIGDFLDAPINTYSSGMRVRLGFSIAIHCEPDILLVDEVLSVGDLSFRNKSMRKMAEFREKANALIFISHNLDQIKNLCTRLVVMDKGKIIYSGNTYSGIVFFEEKSRETRSEDYNKALSKVYECDTEKIEIINFGILGENGNEANGIDLKQPMIAFIDFKLKTLIDEMRFSFAVRSEDNKICIWVHSNDYSKITFSNLKPGLYREKVTIKNHCLGTGVYFLSFGITNPKTTEKYIKIHTQKSFYVKTDGRKLEQGVINVQEEWDLTKIKK